MPEEVSKPKIDREKIEKLKKQLATMADFEVEWIKNAVLEEWDKRNFDWVKIKLVRGQIEVQEEEKG